MPHRQFRGQPAPTPPTRRPGLYPSDERYDYVHQRREHQAKTRHAYDPHTGTAYDYSRGRGRLRAPPERIKLALQGLQIPSTSVQYTTGLADYTRLHKMGIYASIQLCHSYLHSRHCVDMDDCEALHHNSSVHIEHNHPDLPATLHVALHGDCIDIHLDELLPTRGKEDAVACYEHAGVLGCIVECYTFHATGECRYGQDCRYAHVRTRTTPCRYGAACRNYPTCGFRHTPHSHGTPTWDAPRPWPKPAYA